MHVAGTLIQWPRLQLGRYIRAVTGHNNLLYHLHNMHAIISPICRFCLEDNEEFYHLANHCPALYWDRQQIWAQDPKAETWTPQQIINFTCIPRINDAFAKPLYITNDQRLNEIQSQTLPASPNPDDPDSTRSDISVMDATSIDDSSSSDVEMNTDSNSDIDIMN